MLKSILLIDGFLDHHSFLKTHLGIQSIFSFRVGSKPFREYFDELVVKKLSRAYDPLWTDLDASNRMLVELKATLEERIPGFRQYRNLVIYPGTLHFDDWQELTTILVKASYSDQILRIDPKIDLMSIPIKVLDDLELENRTVASLISDHCFECKSSYSFLNSGPAVFNAWRVNTDVRHFNTLQYQDSYLMKTCRIPGKARREYQLLSQLPTELKPYYPAPGKFMDHPGSLGSSYQIEFYPLFDASRILVHGSVSPRAFKLLLDKLTHYFASCPKRQVDVTWYREVAKSLLIEKLRARAKELSLLGVFEKLKNLFDLIFPGGLERLSESVSSEMQRILDRSKESELVFSHGDLCLSNILFDPMTLLIKLIDPRGVESVDEAYFPLLYDLGKLSHSFLGHYELISNNLVDLRITQNLSVTLNYHVQRAYLREIEVVFFEWIERNHWDYSLIRLAEASLFLSLLPLHSDRPGNIALFFQRAVNAYQAAVGQGVEND